MMLAQSFKFIGIGTMGLLMQSCILFGVRNLEEPSYTVLTKDENIEIRCYKPHILARTTIEGGFDESKNQAFRRLAGYIFGGNQSKTKLSQDKNATTLVNQSESIEMTAPVGQELRDGTYTMSFMMPSQYQLSTLPKPNDDRIWFEEVPAKTVAAVQFSWAASEERYQKYAKVLLDWLDQKKSYEIQSLPNFAAYNPPLTVPFLKTNEVLIEVKGGNQNCSG